MDEAEAQGKSPFRRALDEILDLIAPRRCVGCGEPSRELFCATCEANVELIDGPQCPRCGHPHPPTAHAWPLCADCRQVEKIMLDGARSAGFHIGPLRQAVLDFKFKDRRSLAEPLGAMLARRFTNELARPHKLPFDEIDGIVPVILHPTRHRWRGFDQARLLSDELAKGCGKPVWDGVLERVKNTTPQIELTAQQRAQNMQGAFEARKTWKVDGASLLLIDDVYTTGVTLREAARALKEAGASSVYALTITRAAPDWHPKAFPSLEGRA